MEGETAHIQSEDYQELLGQASQDNENANSSCHQMRGQVREEQQENLHSHIQHCSDEEKSQYLQQSRIAATERNLHNQSTLHQDQ